VKEKATIAERSPNARGKMKFPSFVFILGCIILVFTGCTIAPDAPSEGIWYCEELKLAIEFEGREASVSSYDEKLSHMDLQLRNWIDGGVDIVYQNEEGQIVEIYSGWRKSKRNDTFVIRLYRKANPEDNYQTQIELNDEKHTFVKIESYDEIKK